MAITGIAAIQSLSQSSGSIYGGTVLTINGNGFSTIQNTKVKFGTKYCIIQSVTSSNLTCITPSNSAGSSIVSIM